MAAKCEDMNHHTVPNPGVPNGVSHDLQDDIVISGISGRLPNSLNLEEFRKNLFEGIDCVTEKDSRWAATFGLTKRMGTIKNICSFDASFFDIDPKKANIMDPQVRMLLELTYEAIFDAGFNPHSMKGKRIGVFVGGSWTDTHQFWLNDPDLIDRNVLTTCSMAMLPHQISYMYDFKGPSCILDTACSGSLTALHEAIISIRNGDCDAAIIGGSNLVLKITHSLQFQSLNMLSKDGTCRTFDADGKGYVRSDAVLTMFLQKSKDARRIYTTILKSKTNVDGYKIEGITYPSGEMQYRLMREVYDEIGINPLDIPYIEAHGTGTPVGDPEEVNNITKIFCKNRKGPLLIGSVKSNMGHSEPSSGLCSIAKVIFAMENGIIPPNLHYKKPNPTIPGLTDGRLQVIDKPTPWKGGLVSLNNFGFGGANVHVLFRSNQKTKSSPAVDIKFPKLVALSGRTIEAVNYLLDAVKKEEKDDEFIALIRDIHVDNIPRHTVRAFEILGTPNSREVYNYTEAKRPIWFVFSGMGSQWEGMGRQLMCIETFRRSLERCAAALKPVGIDLMDLILNGTNETYENITKCLVSIAAVQIGLVDLLTLFDIHADGIVGHSAGELGCSYVDGTFTAEQMVLTTYWRGKSLEDGNLIPGAMAAVGLSWEETTKRCPPGIYPSCNNSADSVTISGPTEPVHKFVKELQNEGIFAKIVESSGFAFHCNYVDAVGPTLQGMLEKVIPNPKKRSSRWISTSIPESDWDSPLAQNSSAEYHVNNLLSPVLFREAIAHIPENAITIEIGPHSLLQAILRRSLPSTVTNIGIQKRHHKDNLSFFLSSIGKLYAAGAQPKISNFYPPITYPVSRGTPMLNSLIKWDHSVKWRFVNFSHLTHAAESFIDVNVSTEADAFISGHKIDGRVLYPATGYLRLVWKTLARLNDMDTEKMPVVFENVQFRRATIIPKKDTVKFMINIFTQSGDFEICESGSVAVTGRIRRTENIQMEQLKLAPIQMDEEARLTKLVTKDIYKEFRLRGYDYSGLFKGMESANRQGSRAELYWYNNWISFMDSMLQLCMLSSDNRGLYIPTRIEYVSIDPVTHLNLASKLSEECNTIPLCFYKNINCLQAGGIEIRGLKTSLTQRRQESQAEPIHESYTFVPYNNNERLSKNPDKCKLRALSVLLHIVLENVSSSKVKVAEVADNRKMEDLLMSHVSRILYCESIVNLVDSQLITTSPNNYSTVIEQSTAKITPNIASTEQDFDLVLAADIITNKNLIELKNLSAALHHGGFIILAESGEYDMNFLKDANLICVAVQQMSENRLVLLKKIEQRGKPMIVEISDKDFSWLESVKTALKNVENEDQQILLVNQGEGQFGIVGLMNCLRIEYNAGKVSYVFIQDKNAPKFSLTEPFYAEQINKQVFANILKGGQWGCYRHLRLEEQKEVLPRQTEHAFINTLTRGDLSSLRWFESSLKLCQSEKSSNQEMCRVYYASLNFRDIMCATGKLPPDALPAHTASQECILGIEFSGRDTKGRRVMGMVPAQGLATSVLADPLFLWEVPDKWSMEEAVTIPVAYATSYYALFMRGRLQPGESILIHAGSGGVGLASIALALHTGCKVFTTVGSEEKRAFLKKTFPQLTDRNIGNSRDTSFEQLIMIETNGCGVNVVLNSLAEEKLQASVRCLAENGRFLEIGKYDLAFNNCLDTSLLVNKKFHGILLDSFFDRRTPEKDELVRLVNEGIQNGAIKPLPMTVFPENQVESAFRYMAMGKHIGKVLLKIREEEAQKIVPLPSPKTVMAIPRTYMNPNKSYILVGGLGGFGLELADWMIRRGAKHIVLTSRSGIRTGYQGLSIERWRKSGVNVVVSTINCTNLDAAQQLIKKSNNVAPVGGIFNLAVVLHDSLIANLNEDNFKAVALPKIDVTKNLDIVSRKHCPSLDYFVVFSSVACGRGNLGQTNYGFANSVMERLIEQRKSIGLHGLAIQWGAVGDVGVVAETMANNETEIRGTLPQRINSCLASMDIFLQQSEPIVSSMVLADRHKAGAAADDANIIESISNILGIKDINLVNPNYSLGELGMDSLMGTEIKQTLERKFDVVVSLQEIRDLTFSKLMELTSPDAKAKESAKSAIKSDTNDNANDVLLFQLEDDKIIPTEAFVKLESKSSKGTPLFLIHAIEGFILPLKTLALELDRPVWGFQCTQDTPLDSLTITARAYIKQMKQVQKNGPYHLTGYSYGSAIGFEMGLELEKMGEEVVLTLIDGSPIFISSHILTNKTTFGDSEENLLDNYVKCFAFFVSRLKGDITYSMGYSILKSAQTKEEALTKMIELIGNTKFKPEELKIAVMMFCHKLLAGDTYEPTGKFGGKITLIKARDRFMSLSHDYGLSKVCVQDVRIEEIPGDHRSILVGDNAKKIANILGM